jgi:hypothetical protein
MLSGIATTRWCMMQKMRWLIICQVLQLMDKNLRTWLPIDQTPEAPPTKRGIGIYPCFVTMKLCSIVTYSDVAFQKNSVCDLYYNADRKMIVQMWPSKRTRINIASWKLVNMEYLINNKYSRHAQMQTQWLHKTGSHRTCSVIVLRIISKPWDCIEQWSIATTK